MTKQINMILTNHDLERLYYEYNQFKDHLILLLMPSRVKEFRKNNDHLYMSLKKDQTRIFQKYFEHDQEGKIKYTGKGAEKKPIMKEGMLLDYYNMEFNELMDMKLEVRI